MKKLLALNIAALAMSALLALLLVRSTTNAASSLEDMASLTQEINHAQEIRKEMLVMGDSMRSGSPCNRKSSSSVAASVRWKSVKR